MKRNSTCLLGGAAFCLLVLLSAAPPAAAATFEVTNLNASGTGSLAKAVSDANTAAGADVVTFQAGLTGTITPSATLTVSTPLVIKGPGAGAITVSGADARTVFSVTGGPAVISGLKITKGLSSTGGGISNLATLSVVNCVFQDNFASVGAGIYSQSALKVANCVFSGNYSSAGGGVAVYGGTAVVTNSTFSGNYAAANAGGGIYNLATLTVNNCILWGNYNLQIQNVVTATVNSSNVQGGWSGAGTGNLNQDPHFARNYAIGPDNTVATNDDDFGDFHLQPDSPSIDAGNSALVPATDDADLDADTVTAEQLPLDLDLNPRSTAGAVDQGAYEAPDLTPLTGDVTGNVQVTVAQYLPNPATRTYQFYLRVKNLAAAPLQGPLKLVFNGLPAVQCTNRVGLSAGSPFVTAAPPGGVVASEGSVLVLVRLQLPANPGGVLPGTLQVFAGP